jgi:hypothetical protein
MPYRICWERRGVYRQYFGDVTIAQRFESFEAITSNPRFDALRYLITDYLDVGAYETTSEATMEMAALHAGPLATNPRIAMAAVVVNRQDIAAAITEFIGHRFTTVPYEVFPTLAQARKWVDSTLGWAWWLRR